MTVLEQGNWTLDRLLSSSLHTNLFVCPLETRATGQSIFYHLPVWPYTIQLWVECDQYSAEQIEMRQFQLRRQNNSKNNKFKFITQYDQDTQNSRCALTFIYNNSM